jgi:hypothetical protein
MPPRLLCLAIVAFWLFTTAWLIDRDIWPRFAPGEPPLLPTVADDATRPGRLQRNALIWQAVRSAPNAKDQVYQVRTTGMYHADEMTYEFRALIEPRGPDAQNPEVLKVFRLGRLTSSYRVHPDGSMKSFEVGVEMPTNVKVVKDHRAHFHGVVEGKVCNLSWERSNLSQQGADEQKPRSGIEPFEVASRRAVVWLPLHPLYWIRGLKPGQSWGQPAFDALGQSGLLSATPTATWVNARVRKEPAVRTWRSQEVQCLVIDYEGENLGGQTWVSTENETVLFMDVHLLDGERWQITRESR